MYLLRPSIILLALLSTPVHAGGFFENLFSTQQQTITSTVQRISTLEEVVKALERRITALEIPQSGPEKPSTPTPPPITQPPVELPGKPTPGIPVTPSTLTPIPTPELPTSCDGIPNCSTWNVDMQTRGITYKDAFKDLDRETPATLIIEEGEYNVVTTPYLSNYRGLRVIGVGDVRIKGGMVDPSKGYTVGTFLGYGSSNSGELVVANIRFDGGAHGGRWAGQCIYAGSRHTQQDIKLVNIELFRCGHGLMGAAETRYDWPETTQDDTWLLDNVLCHASVSHCVYIDRSAHAEVRNSRFYDPGNGKHALKVISREIDIHDNEVSNAMLDGSASRTTGNASLSLVSCQTGRVADNKITFRYDRGGRPGANGTGGHIIDFQPRWVLHGCDSPAYESDEFWDPAYWADPDHRMEKVVSGNEIVLTTAPEQNRPKFSIVVNQGTLPVTAKRWGSTHLVPLPRPDGWYERSHVTVEGNSFVNMMAGDSVCVSKYWGQRDTNDDWPALDEQTVTGSDCSLTF